MLNLNNTVINIEIDKILPCIQDAITGEIKETIVFNIKSKTFLKNYKRKNGWYINWDKLPDNIYIFAIALKDSKEIQGLIALKNDFEAKAAFIQWACVAPQNNKYEYGYKKYNGVGGHLFAIAVDMSIQWGYNGVVYAFAANEELLEHYVNSLNASYIGILHNFHFVLYENEAKKLLEVYNYEWNEI